MSSYRVFQRLCLNGDNDGDSSFHSDSDDESDEYYDGYFYNWSVKVTDSIAKGESVMVSKVCTYSYFLCNAEEWYLFLFV